MLAALVVATGCPATAVAALSAPALLQAADNCRKELYDSAAKKKFRHNWLRCLQRYERISARHPKSDEAAWALYHAARGYADLYRHSQRASDLDKALELFRQLTDCYPEHRLADDAQYGIGELLYEEKKDVTQAYVEFLKLDIRYPGGDMRPRARKRLEELSTLLNQREPEAVTAKETPAPARSGRVAVKEIRHWSTATYTRVVIDLAQPVNYDHNLLPADQGHNKPRRIYIDLKGARVSRDIESHIPIKDGLLQRARAAQYAPDTVRVVLDIESIGGYKVFPLHDPFRIVVDVKRSEAAEPQVQARTAGTPPPPDPRERVRKGVQRSEGPDKSVSLARQLGLSVRRIVIDPGHGGKDPGAFLPGGIREKDIVLDIAKQLAGRIEREIGCEVILTRTADVFLSLEQRTAIANMNKADLFISLHINAHRSSGIWGLETYFLNMATDERAVMVAARENATSEKNISDLQTILNDLMLNTKIHESSRLAHEVQGGMVSSITQSFKPVKSLGVKQAPFYVLIGAEMPAVLVETGFLTNPMEKKRLLNGSYQERMAAGITAGIRSYIQSIEAVYSGG